MKKIYKLILIAIFTFYLSGSFATENTNFNNIEKNYFQFTIDKYHTTRQSGQIVNIYVKYAYKKNLPIAEYPDYRILRERILKYMEPSDKFPVDVFWEVLATSMGRELMHDFPLSGVSIQLYVLDNENSNINEPGDHGPTYTIGNIEPLDIHK